MAITIYNRDGTAKNSEPGFAPQSIVAKLLRSGAEQGITNGIWVKATFNTVAFDPYGITDAANHRLVIKTPGYYNVQAHMAWTGSGQANSRWGDLRHYDSSGVQKTNRIDNRLAAVAGGTQHSAAFSPIYCAAGDYFELWAYNDNSQNLTNLTALEAYMVGASVGVAPEPWHIVGASGEPGFQNSWTHWGAAPNPLAGFKKTPDGTIHLKGRLKSGSSGMVAFTLPVGYRPTEERRFQGSPNLVFVQTNGDVSIWGAAGVITETNIEVSFQP